MHVPLLYSSSSQDALVQAVASVNNNTIVVVNTVGPIITEAWVTNENGMLKLVSPSFISTDLRFLKSLPWYE